MSEILDGEPARALFEFCARKMGLEAQDLYRSYLARHVSAGMNFNFAEHMMPSQVLDLYMGSDGAKPPAFFNIRNRSDLGRLFFLTEITGVIIEFCGGVEEFVKAIKVYDGRVWNVTERKEHVGTEIVYFKLTDKRRKLHVYKEFPPPKMHFPLMGEIFLARPLPERPHVYVSVDTCYFKAMQDLLAEFHPHHAEIFSPCLTLDELERDGQLLLPEELRILIVVHLGSDGSQKLYKKPSKQERFAVFRCRRCSIT